MPHTFDPHAFGPTLAPLLDIDRCRPLGPGTPNGSMHSRLAALSEQSIVGESATDPDMARACLSGLWLLHDFLDESHHISQEIETPTGSYWHGIMHRREGDFSNAKYWFRRVGRHPIFESLATAAEQRISVATESADSLQLSTTPWDPYAFIDACESTQRRGKDNALLRNIAQVEWELLFEYSYQRSCGGSA